MILVGIDIGKSKHFFCVVNKVNGEVLIEPTSFLNNANGFSSLIQSIRSFDKDSILIGMEDTGHYHFALLKHLLSCGFKVALINPVATDLTRKMQGGISKNDKLDTLTICDVLASASRKKPYRLTKIDRFDLYEQRQLTRHHHNLKEELNIYLNRLQKSIDIVFPEFNGLFKSKYGIVYRNILKTFQSAHSIATADIRSIRKCFDIQGRGKRISLTAEQLKQAAKASVGFYSLAEEIQIRHLIAQIELIHAQLTEIDKK